MRFKPLHLASLSALAALAAGCVGSGGGSDQGGTTAQTAGQIAQPYLFACVDQNANWQCDDGDTGKIVTATGATGLSPAAGQYVLLESRDTANSRTRLLISEKGSATVDGLSTLKAVLGADYLPALASQISAATLEAGYVAAQAANPQALAALEAYSRAVLANPAAPAVGATATTVAAATTLADWAGESGDSRQLSAVGSLVLGNNESNRLYLFDADVSPLDADQLDLIPQADALAALKTWSGRLLAAMDSALSIVVSTVSAASGGSTTPVDNVVTLPAGKGINGIRLAGNGSQAYVLLNTGADRYTGAACAAAGSEGLFRVPLSALTAGSISLSAVPRCVHSGFSLLAADAGGSHLVGWDASDQRLWSLAGDNLALEARIDPGVTTPQALAVSPGGRYAAVAGYGQVAVIDLQEKKTLGVFTGSWTNATQVAFAGGHRRLLVAAGSQVHTVALDRGLQLISMSATALTEEVRSLAVAPDGDSYAAIGDAKVSWRAVLGGAELANRSLAAGLAVKSATFARNAASPLATGRLLLTAQRASDQRFVLYQLTVSLPKQPG